jgi:acetyl-CoA carboxylase biotin carboxyl carrier protein
VPLTFKEIAEVIRLIDASSCDEFVVEVGDIKLAVRRKAAGTTASELSPKSRRPVPSTAEQSPSPAVAGAPEAEAQVTESATSPAVTTARADRLIEVRSPMTGLFYRKSAPDAEPFVSVGSPIKKGDPLCMVEVMKLFTTIEAEQSGRIVEITVQDGQLVEHNQILFLIEPA